MKTGISFASSRKKTGSQYISLVSRLLFLADNSTLMKMKLSVATLFTLFVPALSYRIQLYTDHNGQRQLEPIPEYVLERGRRAQRERKLQAEASSETEAPMPEGYVNPNLWDDKWCVTYELLAKVDEILASERNTTFGATLSFPIYFAEDPDNAIGLFNDGATMLNELHLDKCVFTGSFSFGAPSNQTGLYLDQIFLSGTCRGNSNVITGGTGVFACASGYETFTDPPSSDLLAFTATYCSGCEF